MFPTSNHYPDSIHTGVLNALDLDGRIKEGKGRLLEVYLDFEDREILDGEVGSEA